MGQWSRSEVDGEFVALTAVCSTHGCVQLCEDAKAVRVSRMDAAVCLPVCGCAGWVPQKVMPCMFPRHDLEKDAGVAWSGGTE